MRSLILILLLFLFLNVSFVSSSTWWNESYTYKYPIDCTNVRDNTSIVINGTYGVNIDGEIQTIWTYCSGEGTSLYFNNRTDYKVANDSDQLPMEIERGNGTSYDPLNVWDNNFVLVHHFNADPSGSAPQFIDSTHKNNATSEGSMTTSDWVASKIGGGQELDGTDDMMTQGYVDIPTGDDSRSIDVVAKVTSNTVTSGNEIFIRMGAGSPQNAMFGVGTLGAQPDNFDVWANNHDTYGSISLQADTWYTFHLVYNSSASYLETWVNGVKDIDESETNYATVADTVYLGGTMAFEGILDMVRVSNISRDELYVEETYNNIEGNSGYGDTPTLEAFNDSAPYWSLNSTSDPIISTNVTHLLKWNDDVGLVGYIFSWFKGSNTTSCVGSLDCSVHSTEASCNNCSECNWTTGFSTNTTPRTCSDVWGASCSGSDPTTSDYSYGGCSCGSYYGSGFWVDEVTVNVTTAVIGETIKVTCNYDCYSTAALNDWAISYYNGSGWAVGSTGESCTDGDYTATFNVTGELGVQYVRCSIGYDLYNPSTPCFTTNYADNDDVNFTVVQGIGCTEIGSCSNCSVNECGTNCSSCDIESVDFFNDSVVYFTGLENWTSVDKNINSTAGVIYKWKVYAWDIIGQINESVVFSYTSETEAEGNCTCPGSGENWEIDLTEGCELSTDCSLGTGNVTFTNTGTFKCNAWLNVTNFGDLSTDQHIIVNSSCHIRILE